MDVTLPRRLAAEALGTALLIVFGPGSVVAALQVGDGVGYPRAILVEALGTYLLVLAIFALAVDRRAPVGWAGLIIGLSVTGLVLVLAPLTGAAVNPARAFGPLVGAAVSGGEANWSQFPAYVIGSLLGGLAAALSYDLLARPRRHDPAPEPAQGAAGDVVGHRT